VNRSVSSCIRAAQANPRNAQRSAAAIQQECSCYANKMADSISPAEDQSLNSDDAARIREVLGPRIEAAAAACKPANM
jgi:hypothetical protein